MVWINLWGVCPLLNIFFVQFYFWECCVGIVYQMLWSFPRINRVLYCLVSCLETSHLFSIQRKIQYVFCYVLFTCLLKSCDFIKYEFDSVFIWIIFIVLKEITCYHNCIWSFINCFSSLYLFTFVIIIWLH